MMYNVSYYSEKNVRYQLLNEQLHQQLYTYYTHITRQRVLELVQQLLRFVNIDVVQL